MQKIINAPDRFVDEMLEGILEAHPDRLSAVARRAIVRADAPVAGKVAIVTGGGSGHLPVFMGYVGRGFADGVAVGEVFASPNAAGASISLLKLDEELIRLLDAAAESPFVQQ